jgi:hypothetical protein
MDFWLDDLAKMAWDSALEPLAAKDTALWIIIGTEATWQTPSIRQGLSLLARARPKQHLPQRNPAHGGNGVEVQMVI